MQGNGNHRLRLFWFWDKEKKNKKQTSSFRQTVGTGHVMVIPSDVAVGYYFILISPTKILKPIDVELEIDYFCVPIKIMGRPPNLT